MISNYVVLLIRCHIFPFEQSRVVQAADGERSYNIFYQLCAGAPKNLKGTPFKSLCYWFLNFGQCDHPVMLIYFDVWSSFAVEIGIEALGNFQVKVLH